MSPVRSSVNERNAPRRAGRARGARATTLGAPTAQQAVLGEHRELQRRRHEALAQRGGGEAQRGLQRRARDVDVAVEPVGLQATEVVGGALAFAAPGESHDRAVAGAHELLQLGLGLGERARGGVGGRGAQLYLLAA